jgi:hypothetical protein
MLRAWFALFFALFSPAFCLFLAALLNIFAACTLPVSLGFIAFVWIIRTCITLARVRAFAA